MQRSHVLMSVSLLISCGDDRATDAGADGGSETGDGDGDGDAAEAGEASGDGDGEPGDGDGEPGDGDGEPGDGDGEPGDGDGEPGDGDGDTGDGDGEPGDGDGDTGDGDGEPDHPLWTTPNLWYSVENRLHYIEIDPDDGSVVQLVTSTITTPMINGQNGITMLEDGSLLLSRESPGATEIYHVPEPPMVATELEVTLLGEVPDELRIEALYTDCQGLVYLMDTGVDVSSAEGNRLIRFTGDYLAGDLSYEVITDLEQASVADIDDLGPGIDDLGEITDGVGFAIDSGTVYEFDYNTGTGTLLGMGGTWGIHALGGPLFTDGVARLYIFNSVAELFEADPETLALSPVLVAGPEPEGSAYPGWSGITGPLTECESTLPDPQ
ncbi:MAG: hypothetical protein R6X02_07825 [Enhygromyxa sp.]